MHRPPTPKRLLVANRGEIAVRVLRAAAELAWPTVAVFSEDDARALHVRRADVARPLRGAGPTAYLDAAQLIGIARETGCDLVHPGYGFLSERADFAEACRDAGLGFVGPRPETLALLGDKTAARDLARRHDVPVLPGTFAATTLEEARRFRAALGPDDALVVKARAGGGGRGMRVVRPGDDLDAAYRRCASEAAAAFGDGALYVERLLPRARHLEVQIVGDGSGAVVHLGERECSLQRRHQKLVEVAPSPRLEAVLRARLTDAAVRLGRAVGYAGVGTVEFLLGEPGPVFLEANPRLQVEHTVTEMVTGLDLVHLQLHLAAGATLAELGLAQDRVPAPRGCAVQVRVNMETLDAAGTVRPGGGTIAVFEPPSGPGLRVDTFGYAGYTTTPRFDALLAKLIAHAADHATAVAKARRALREFRVEGVPTNLPLLERLLALPAVAAGAVDTGFVEEQLAALLAPEPAAPAPLFFASEAPPHGAAGRAGAQIDAVDPLAVLAHGKGSTAGGAAAPPRPSSPLADVPPLGPDEVCVVAPLQGTVVTVDVAVGDAVAAGHALLVMEAMKMEHVVAAPAGGVVRRLGAAAGDTVRERHPLVVLAARDVAVAAGAVAVTVDLDHVRPDLAEVHARHAVGLDAARPEAVARRHAKGQRTARENVDDLCDPGSFVEYGALALAAQRRRRTLDDLVARTPADGLVCGVGRVNGDRFSPERARCAVLAYDYTVLAGTQGLQNHRKKDRLFALAHEQRLPVVFFTEGGGGRPGDTDGAGVAGLDCLAFRSFGRLSGLVPLVGVNAGRCFAGNAALLGCCDVVIATEDSSIGMGGPAMIEGGGLGVFHPDEVGPMRVQRANGVVDVAVRDEAEGVRVAKQYLSYFQGPVADWSCADQRRLRTAIPENRLRVYDVRSVIETLADTGSVLELRRGFGAGMVTALARVEGRPLGIVANDPMHLAGAIDPDAADKAARFLQLCDAFDVPLLFLCDTPGIMVGPEVEKRAMVRHAARLFVVGASLSVPFCTIVLRKGYGLGAQAMAGGSFHAPVLTVAWPTGEFGGMGLEGAVKLGFRKELAAVEDPAARRRLFDDMVARMYEIGKGVNMASHFEIDDVIDPIDSRRVVASALHQGPPPAPRTGKKRPCVDTW
ncbi:MAG: ATP-grasp domain-containing protein [bacterium]|nr:ATP-grasp domain-containing protein [bacterium]